MKRLATFVVTAPRRAWLVALLVIVALSLGVTAEVRRWRASERQSLLAIKAERLGVEILAQTLSGGLMGSLGLLGLIDDEVKLDAAGVGAPNGVRLLQTLATVGQAYQVDGVYVVGSVGLIRTSWDAERSLTGVNVRFRPYVQTALQGKQNIYAAIGTTTGKRTLYFASPIRAAAAADGAVLGVLTARSGTVALDRLLAAQAGPAMLVSPQGLVFASSKADWIGRLTLPLTPERLKAIRELRQFGTQFDQREPQPLGFAIDGLITELDGVRHAVARSTIGWRDPGGEWTLVLLEDLERSIPRAELLAAGVVAACGFLLLALLALRVLRDSHHQAEAARQLGDFARAHEAAAARKTSLAAWSLRLQQSGDPAALAASFLSEAQVRFAALQGLIYLVPAGPVPADAPLQLAASYGCASAPPALLHSGDGLLGQCIVERRRELLTRPADSPWMIHSGLGNASPAALLLAPLLHETTLTGVIELAFLSVPSDADLEHLDEMMALLAINLQIRRKDAPAQTENR